MEKILSIHKLSKFYGRRQVLKNLSLEVEKGCTFGLLGPNGSGKTTTLSILLDVVPQNGGTFKWFEQEPTHKHRRRIGSLLESPNFLGYLSAERNLKIAADIKGVPYSDIERVLTFVNLHDRRKDKFKAYSLGMKQRLAIASALLGNPEVLILDEPTNGLDPQGIYEIRELILRISAQGITIVIASHILDEVEKVCSDVAILKEGALLVQGKVADILADDNLLEVKSDDMDALEKALNEIDSIISIKKDFDKFTLKLPQGASNSEINRQLFEKGVVTTHLSSIKKNLEMQFLEITKNG